MCFFFNCMSFSINYTSSCLPNWFRTVCYLISRLTTLSWFFVTDNFLHYGVVWHLFWFISIIHYLHVRVQKGFILSQDIHIWQYLHADTKIVGLSGDIYVLCRIWLRVFFVSSAKPEHGLICWGRTYQQRFIHYDYLICLGHLNQDLVNIIKTGSNYCMPKKPWYEALLRAEQSDAEFI